MDPQTNGEETTLVIPPNLPHRHSVYINYQIEQFHIFEDLQLATRGNPAMAFTVSTASPQKT